MTRHETIIAGRGARKRPVRVERRTSRWIRRDVHHVGLAAVAHELGFVDEGLGGVLTGERMRGLLGKRDRPNGKPNRATVSTKPALVTTCAADLSTGLLVDDVCRHIWAERGRFAPILYGSGM